MNKNIGIVLIAFIVIAVGGVFYANQQAQKTKMEQEKVAMIKQKEEAKAKEEIAMKEKQVMEKKNQEVTAMAMNDTSSKKGKLFDVTGGISSGMAYLLRKDKLYHSLTANLPDPKEGTFYEGWLVNKTPKLAYFSTGMLEKTKDGSYALSYSSDNLYQGYDFVVVTLETVKDSNPEKHILEGTVK